MLREAGIDNAEKAAAVIKIAASISRSPYPSPDMLRAYEDFRPGMADKVLEQVHAQTRHRQELEKQRSGGSEGRMDIAQRNAYRIAGLGILVAAGVAYYSWFVAAVIVVVSVGGTVVARLLDRFTKVSSPN